MRPGTQLNGGVCLGPPFGRRRWKVQRLQLLLCVSAACAAQHPGLRAQADALNAQLVTDWALARAPPMATRSEQQACYCLVAEREQLHPAALRALLQDGWHVVTPAWVRQAAVRKVSAHSLPPAAAYAPHTLLLPPLDAAARGSDMQQQQPPAVDVGAWRPPSSSLLSAFRLVFGPACQVSAAATCTMHGAGETGARGQTQAHSPNLPGWSSSLAHSMSSGMCV